MVTLDHRIRGSALMGVAAAQHAVLALLASGGDEHEPCFFTLRALERDLCLDREVLRGLIADLRRRGLVQHRNGLWHDDGTPMGSGYVITAKGRAHGTRQAPGASGAGEGMRSGATTGAGACP